MACDNKFPCPCTEPGCPNHGHCCACIAKHRAKNQLPGCYFTKEGEARLDRSFSFFVQDRADDID